MPNSKLIELVENKRFIEAKELIKNYLIMPEVANLKSDESYYISVDYLDCGILKEEGPENYSIY